MAAKRAELGQIRPYDLRHTFVSLLIAERRTSVDTDRRADHSPTMTLDTYRHVFEELEDAEPVTSEELVRDARDQPSSAALRVRPRDGSVSQTETKNQKTPLSGACREPTRGFEPRAPSLRALTLCRRPS
jgi:hypothetical protein